MDAHPPTAAFDTPVFDATNARHRALGHPIRHRILLALGDAPATLSQLSRRLTVPKGGVAHHLKVLVDADLIRRADARTVRGGTEVYYERTHSRLHVDPTADPDAQHAALVAVADAVAADPDDPLLVLRGLRLSDAQARRLKVTLTAFVDDLDESPSGRRHGLLVGVYAL